MKKLLSIMLCLFCMALVEVSAQVVDASGQRKFKGNVAVIVNTDCYSFKDGEYYVPNAYKSMLNGEENMLRTALEALAQEKLADACFAIVNRNDEIQKKVRTLLVQNKMEDYLNGLSVQAKNEGADYILLVDQTVVSLEEGKACLELSLRMVSVATNVGVHRTLRSDFFDSASMEQFAKTSESFAHDMSQYMTTFLHEFMPEMYGIVEANGKSLKMAPYQPNGSLGESDQFYLFHTAQGGSVKVGTTDVPVMRYEPIGVASNAHLDGGYMAVTSNAVVANPSTTFAIKNVNCTKMGATITTTYFGFNTKEATARTFDGFIKKRINQAVCHAISEHPMMLLIEQDMNAALKAERELQKTEDFLNGHTAERMKAVGASALVQINNYTRQGDSIAFVFNRIDVATNSIVKTATIVCHINDIEKTIANQMNNLIIAPCEIDEVGKKEILLHSHMCLAAQPETEGRLYYMKEIANPLTGEKTFSRVELCNLEYKEFRGNYHLFTIKEILDKDGMANINALCSKGASFFVKVDGSSGDVVLNVGKKRTAGQKMADKFGGVVNKAKSLLDKKGEANKKDSSGSDVKKAKLQDFEELVGFHRIEGDEISHLDTQLKYESKRFTMKVGEYWYPITVAKNPAFGRDGNKGKFKYVCYVDTEPLVFYFDSETLTKNDYDDPDALKRAMKNLNKSMDRELNSIPRPGSNM